MTITVPRVDARVVGARIAIFERAVGLYASLVGVNAYHQPGVEAGKKAAAGVLTIQAKALAALSTTPRTAKQIAETIGSPQERKPSISCLSIWRPMAAHMAGPGDPGQAAFSRM